MLFGYYYVMKMVIWNVSIFIGLFCMCVYVNYTTAIQGNQESVCSPLNQGEYLKEVMKIFEMHFIVILWYSLSNGYSYLQQKYIYSWIKFRNNFLSQTTQRKLR